jgi:mRNA interferase MazF
MVDYQPGDVVLLWVPFSGGAGGKNRPALVMQDTGDLDFVVATVTSYSVRDSLDVSLQDWRQAGLLLQSTARVHKLETLEKRLVRRVLGRLSAHDWNNVQAVVRRLWC